MGWENVFHCEWNDFGKKVLNHYWPKAISYHDITKTDFTIHRGRIDILTGGFPCQPYSMAGKRLGKEDERHLWPEMLRAIKEIQPRWVVGENVYGLVNWSGGLVFHEVQTDLEAEGYEVFPYVLPACSVNAPHRRDRVWFVAYKSSEGLERSAGARLQRRGNGFANIGNERNAPHPDCNGLNEKRGYDWSSKDVTRSHNENIRRTNTKDIDGCGADGILKATPTTCERTCRERDDETNKVAESGRFCELDNISNEQEKIKCRNEPAIDSSGTLVSDKQNGVQLPLNNGLGKNSTIIQSKSGNELQNDVSRINPMERNAPHPGNEGLEGCKDGGSVGRSREESYQQFTRCLRSNWHNFPTQSPIRFRNDGLSSQLDGITFSKWRNESIKAAGNAIVPQVVLQIFKAIQEYETPTLQAEV